VKQTKTKGKTTMSKTKRATAKKERAPKKIQFHPLCEMFPVMDETELGQLADDIKAHGQREPILTLKGQIIDGRNRYLACQRVNQKPRFKALNTKNPAEVVASLNVHRRHLTESQRAMMLMELGGISAGAESRDPSIAQAAKMSRTSTGTIKRAKNVKAKAVKKVKKAVLAGKLTVHEAAKIAKLPKAKQQKIARGGIKAMKAASKPLPRGGLAADAIRRKQAEAEKDNGERETKHTWEQSSDHSLLEDAFTTLEKSFTKRLEELTNGVDSDGPFTTTPQAIMDWLLKVLHDNQKAALKA